MTVRRDPSPSDEWAEAVAGDLVEKLDTLAFEHEKVLDKLDIKRAKAARSLSMELSTIRRTLGSIPRDPDDHRTNEILDLYRELRQRAFALLSGAPLGEETVATESGPPRRLTPPPASNRRSIEDADLDEITAARTPESLRTTPRRR